MVGYGHDGLYIYWWWLYMVTVRLGMLGYSCVIRLFMRIAVVAILLMVGDVNSVFCAVCCYLVGWLTY